MHELAAKELGINNAKIGIGGNSAGGNLTAVMSHMAAGYSEKISIVYQLLLVPVTDNTADAKSHVSWKENEHAPQLPAAKMMWYRRNYLPNKADWTNLRASPVFYPDESFAKCPPAFVALAECDVLRTEGELYAKKLRDNGVKTTLRIYEGSPHPVPTMTAVMLKARELVAETSAALEDSFYN